MQAIKTWDGESSLVVQMAPQPLWRVLNEGDKTVHGIRIEMKKESRGPNGATSRQVLAEIVGRVCLRG
jgi:hypothetical protein